MFQIKLLPLFTISILLCVSACKQDNNNYKTAVSDNKEMAASQTTIQVLHDDLMKNIMKMDKVKATELITKSEEYATTYPEDSIMSPEYLFRAADISRGIGKYNEALRLLDEVYKKYPTYKNRPNALFQQGFIYEAHMGRKDLAKRKYEQFVKDYPTHGLIGNAQQTLKAMEGGKSDLELVKEFQAKEKKK